MSVVIPQTMEACKKNHNILTYYNEIVNGRCPYTIEDLKNMKMQVSNSMSFGFFNERVDSKIFTENDLTGLQ